MKAPCTLMWNKAKTLLVPVGDPEGRFFAYAEGYPIPDDSPLKVPVVKAAPAVKKEREFNG